MTGPLVDLAGRHAVVTGAASGLGRAVAHTLAGVGARVSVLDVNAAGAAQTVTQIRGAGGHADAISPVVTGTVVTGTVVNVSSIGGSTSLGRGNFVYGVSKGGVEQLTRELAVAWAPRGIRVNGVAPCQIATDGLRALGANPSAEGRLIDTFLRGIPLGRLVEPTEVAAAVAFLASDAAAMITGVILPVDGGNLALNAGGTIGD
jgi:NAD(P)-dependent dehydrogenase (short-subunit alcohol dehydrogenase family)